jgi:hypothetical protein
MLSIVTPEQSPAVTPAETPNNQITGNISTQPMQTFDANGSPISIPGHLRFIDPRNLWAPRRSNSSILDETSFSQVHQQSDASFSPSFVSYNLISSEPTATWSFTSERDSSNPLTTTNLAVQTQANPQRRKRSIQVVFQGNEPSFTENFKRRDNDDGHDRGNGNGHGLGMAF